MLHASVVMEICGPAVCILKQEFHRYTRVLQELAHTLLTATTLRQASI